LTTTQGPLQAGPLYGAVYKALEELCPKRSSHCKLESETQAIFPIRFKSPNDILNSSMRVRVERSNHATEQIRRLLIGTVAASVEAMVFEPNNNKLSKNCEELWGDPSHPYFKQCVISNYVVVATTDRRNILDVKFLSVDDHKKGFDCIGSLNDIHEDKGLAGRIWSSTWGPCDDRCVLCLVDSCTVTSTALDCVRSEKSFVGLLITLRASPNKLPLLS
jgi:hypothetical protein